MDPGKDWGMSMGAEEGEAEEGRQKEEGEKNRSANPNVDL